MNAANGLGATVPAATSASSDLLMRTLRWWSLVELPRLNTEIAAGRDRPSALVGAFNAELALVGPPELFSAVQSKQLLVQLGIAGTSVTRNYQESDAYYRERPEYPLDLLAVGPERIPFRDYYVRLAVWSGTRHPRREAYASLIRWNVPTVEVRWQSQRLITSNSAFGDGHTMTYTGDPGERLLWQLIKKCEAVEVAVNRLLCPLSDGTVDFHSREAIDRITMATELVVVIRRLLCGFAPDGDEPPSPTAAYFRAMLRQFGVHWELGDVPPSGPQDPEFLKRDLLLGIDFPGYDERVRRMFPALLGEECDALAALLTRRSLPVELLESLGFGGPADLATMSDAQLATAAARHPVLVAMYLLLRENARLAGTHLRLAKGMLNSAEEPDVDDAGPADSVMDQLTHGRRNHALLPFGRLPLRELAVSVGIPPDHLAADVELDDVVRFA